MQATIIFALSGLLLPLPCLDFPFPLPFVFVVAAPPVLPVVCASLKARLTGRGASFALLVPLPFPCFFTFPLLFSFWSGFACLSEP